MQLNQSRLEPLMRVRRELRNFFLYRILNGLPNPVNTDRGVNRLLSEMQPFLENLVSTYFNKTTCLETADYLK